MANFFKDNEDLQFYVERGIDWDSIISLTERDFKGKDGFANHKEAMEFYRDILATIGEFTAEEIAPKAAAIDAEGAHLTSGEAVLPKAMQDIFRGIAKLDLYGLCVPRELGGLNCPLLMYFIQTELFARADVSVTAHHSFHGGIAASMLIFSMLEGTTEYDADGRITKTRFAKEIAEILQGNAWGCMDITEPDAGSDMAALRAQATQAADGSWTVSGQKIFITSGHGKYHFVIARSEKNDDPHSPQAGLAGLSFFLVPAYEDVAGQRKRLVTIDRIEEKLGHHGSVTAALTFDKSPAQLIGKRGEGFRYMLELMNNARLGVGFEGIGVCEAAYRVARDYAASRPSMGKMIGRHEMIADYLDEMETDIYGLRALGMYGAVHEELGQKRQLLAKQVGGEEAVKLLALSKKSKRAARRVMPLLKYLSAEKAVEISRRAVQILGGNGYMRDYPAERILRDALVLPIYEGTSQIQALMAMKDTMMGIIKNPQEFVKKVAQTRLRSLSARDPLERRVAKVQVSSLSAQQYLMTRTAASKVKSLSGKPLSEWMDEMRKNWNPKRDFALAMLHAERLTKLLAEEAICEILLSQTRKFPERKPILERYLDRAELRARVLEDEITSSGHRVLERLEEDEEEVAVSAG